MRRFTALFLLVLMVAGLALAAGPAPRKVASGSTTVLVALCDTAWTTESFAVNDSVNFSGAIMRVSGTFPELTEIKFPDADITYSFWGFTNPTGVDSVGVWVRLTGRHDNSDTVGTLYAGDILRADERARFVYITRSSTSEGFVNRYW